MKNLKCLGTNKSLLQKGVNTKALEIVKLGVLRPQ